jgi:hypothetical protein
MRIARIRDLPTKYTKDTKGNQYVLRKDRKARKSDGHVLFWVFLISLVSAAYQIKLECEVGQLAE